MAAPPPAPPLPQPALRGALRDACGRAAALGADLAPGARVVARLDDPDGAGGTPIEAATAPYEAAELAADALLRVPLLDRGGAAVGVLAVLPPAGGDAVGRPRPPRAAFERLAAMLAQELGLARSEARLRELLRQTTHAVIVLDPDGTIVEANGGAHELLRVRRGSLVGRAIADMIDPDDLRRRPLRLDAPAEDRPLILERAWRLGDGTRLPVEVHAVRLPDGRLQGIVRDASERSESERLRARHASFRAGLVEMVEASLGSGREEELYGRLLEGAVAVIPGAQSGSLLVREEGSDRFRFTAAVGFDLEALRECWLYEHEMHREGSGPRLIRSYAVPTPEPGRSPAALPREDRERFERIHDSGPTGDIVVTLSLPIEIDGRPAAFLTLDNFEDPDAFEEDALDMARLFAQQVAALLRRFRLEGHLERLAYFDPLTGLPNRRLLEDRLAIALEHARRDGALLAVLHVDLDEFKIVNDLHGHAVGDALLVEAARRIEGCVRDGDTVARWGGDEFVVVLPGVSTPALATEVADRILAALVRPMDVEGLVLRARASIGVHAAPGGDVDTVLRNADIALARAKGAGRGAWRFHTDDMNERLAARHRLETRLREAVARDELTLAFQPRVDLRDGRVRSVEGLARWTSEDGPVPPGAFIPLAEETGLIRDLGLRLLDRALAQTRAWMDAGTPLRMAVNLSARQLQDDAFVDQVAAALRRHRVPGRMLELEVTESVAMADVQGSVDRLRALRSLGILLSIDDFGTAYSSLSYLHRLPVHALKIDRSFAERVADPDGSLPVVQAIVALARALRLGIVAEGIETREQLAALRGLGVEEAQGFLLARPLPAKDVEGLLGRRLGID